MNVNMNLNVEGENVWKVVFCLNKVMVIEVCLWLNLVVLAVFSAKANLEASKCLFDYAYIDIINNIKIDVYFDLWQNLKHLQRHKQPIFYTHTQK